MGTVTSHDTEVGGLHPADHAVLYPTYSFFDNVRDVWHVGIRGQVFRPRADNRRKKLVLRLMRRVLNIHSSAAHSQLFRQRTHGFLVHARRGQQIALRFGPFQGTIRKRSKRTGQFAGTMHLSRAQMESLFDEGHIDNGWLRFEIATQAGGYRSIPGCSQLLEPQGVSVVSDIDDTLKLSSVCRKRELLANTFVRPFQAIPGMADLYDYWADCGAAFHYVSSSPWQLYDPLSRWLGTAGYPLGSLNLRTIRLRDPTVIKLLIAAKRFKKATIKSLMLAYPQRRFLLIGDSGEKDADVYGWIARRFGDQVAGIFIRQLPAKPVSPERLAHAFHDLPRHRWQLFEDTEHLHDMVHQQGLVPWNSTDPANRLSAANRHGAASAVPSGDWGVLV